MRPPGLKQFAVIYGACAAFGGGRAAAQGQQNLIKPTTSDVIKGNVYADNWFMLYINGKLIALDSIDFLPHNQVNVDVLPEYPMMIAVMAKDNADPKTGLEYGTQQRAGWIARTAAECECHSLLEFPIR